MKRPPGRPPLDQTSPNPSADVHLTLPASEYDKADWWEGMIQSEIEAVIVARGGRVVHREHKYSGGLPPLRLRRLQAAHEVRARQAGVPWDFVDLRLVFAKGDGLCGICGLPVEFAKFTVDHVVPMSKGGAHVLANLQPAHFACNSKKGDR